MGGDYYFAAGDFSFSLAADSMNRTIVFFLNNYVMIDIVPFQDMHCLSPTRESICNFADFQLIFPFRLEIIFAY